MTQRPDFNFDDGGVSAAYDDVLVPLFFDPWAEALLLRVSPTEGAHVVDVATGTGIVAQKLADQVGSSGSVTAIDISAEMLAHARQRCDGQAEHSNGSEDKAARRPACAVRFIESPASPLRIYSEVADVVYCQQGFQFFPDKSAAASEMYRVCKPGGRVAVSTWCPVHRCEFFGVICDSLKRCGQGEVAEMIAVPFNHMPGGELAEYFASSGFEDVVVELPELAMIFQHGVEQAFETVFATPIGPRVRAFSEHTMSAFRDGMVTALSRMTRDGVTSCAMVSHLLVARKPT